jgi:cytoskeletal protein RodZ
MPALIYLIFSFTHVVIDTYKKLYNTAIIEVWISVVFTLLLNLLCQQNLGFISWLIISIPFLLMTVIASLILFVFKLNPATGQALQPQPSQSQPVQPSQPQTVQPSQPQSTQAPSQSTQPQPTPSRYSFPITAFYGSLGNYKNPFSTR